MESACGRYRKREWVVDEDYLAVDDAMRGVVGQEREARNRGESLGRIGG